MKNCSNTPNKRHFIVCFITLLILMVNSESYAQVSVSSLAELLPYLNDDSVEVTLTPGTYSINVSDIDSGKFSNPLFLFKGSNSTYNFTGVTIEISTDVLRAFGNVDVNELQILGNYNTIKNLKIVDIGDTRPAKRAQSVVMDGSNNLIDGLHLTVRGSYPYGYGDAFGKGGATVIKHYKHSAILVRGESNHLKNCTIIHRAYGHAIFTQAARNAVIENCYVEGVVRTTDDMLAEEGTGTPGDEKGFMTIWGYKLPPGYMMSLQEGGIRAYNAGTTFINGDTIQRGTENVKVINCTIKRMRTGVALAHAVGTKTVIGCKVIECESGYSIGTGSIINCSGDAKYGPVLTFAYSSDKNCTADITVLPSDSSYNGSGILAYIGGQNNNITLKSSESKINTGLRIQVGGDKKGIRVLNGNFPSQNPLTAKNNTIQNFTAYPMVLDTLSSLNSGVSKGAITDYGTSNSFTLTTINNDIKTKNYRVYPNPVANQLSIKGVQNSKVELFNEVGQLIISTRTNSGEQLINMKSYNPGLYLLKITTNDGEVEKHKIIKQ